MKKKEQVCFTDRAKKDLESIPRFLLVKLLKWQKTIEVDGLNCAKKIRGYHDEALRGERSHQRSIRLNRAYRVIYEVFDKAAVRIIEIQEVNKHKY